MSHTYWHGTPCDCQWGADHGDGTLDGPDFAQPSPASPSPPSDEPRRAGEPRGTRTPQQVRDLMGRSEPSDGIYAWANIPRSAQLREQAARERDRTLGHLDGDMMASPNEIGDAIDECRTTARQLDMTARMLRLSGQRVEMCRTTVRQLDETARMLRDERDAMQRRAEAAEADHDNLRTIK